MAQRAQVVPCVEFGTGAMRTAEELILVEVREQEQENKSVEKGNS